MTAPYKACPKCQTPAALAAPRCERCGHAYRTQFVPPDQTQMFYPGEPFRADRAQYDVAPNVMLIAVMWLSTVVGFCFGLVNLWLSAAIGLGSFVAAILLACSRSKTDRANGWTRIGLGILSGIVTALWLTRANR